MQGWLADKIPQPYCPQVGVERSETNSHTTLGAAIAPLRTSHLIVEESRLSKSQR